MRKLRKSIIQYKRAMDWQQKVESLIGNLQLKTREKKVNRTRPAAQSGLIINAKQF